MQARRPSLLMRARHGPSCRPARRQMQPQLHRPQRGTPASLGCLEDLGVGLPDAATSEARDFAEAAPFAFRERTGGRELSGASTHRWHHSQAPRPEPSQRGGVGGWTGLIGGREAAAARAASTTDAAAAATAPVP